MELSICLYWGNYKTNNEKVHGDILRNKYFVKSNLIGEKGETKDHFK